MITLRLRGSLAACVREHLDDEALGRCGPDEAIVELEARTVAEALSLAGPQAPGFALRWDLGSWRVSVDGRALESAAGLWMHLADRAYVSISPALAGSGPLWAALPLWAKIVVGVSTAYSVYAAGQIPSIPDTEHLAEEGQRRTLFSGPVNSIAQGGAVPLIYGRTRVGSTVISGGLSPDRPTGGKYTSPPAIDLGGNPTEGRPDPAEDPRHGITRDVPPPGEASRSRSTLRVVDLLGEGEIEGLADGLESVFIDGVPVETDGEVDIKGVLVQERRGLPHGHAEQAALAGFDVTATGLPRSSTKVAHGIPVSQRVPQGYDAARVTLMFPQLVQYDENNRALEAEVEVRVETRPAGEMAWTTVLLQTIRDRSLGRRELSWRVERPGTVGAKGVWEIQVSRETTDSEPGEASDAFSWERTFGLRDVKQSYPHSAVVGLTMDLSQSEVNPSRREYEVRGRKVMAPLPSMWDPDKPTSKSAATYGEGMWDGRLAPRWTDNPAWIAYDLLTDHRAGLGGVPGMADAAYAARWEFLELARRCDELVPSPESESAMEPRWRFNGVIERREQARKVVDWVLSACRAGALWSSGHASLAVDGDSDVAAALANANVIDGEFEYQGLRWQERYSAVAVTWRDPDDDYRSGIELVVLDDLVAKYGFRQKDVAAVGCTSRGQAHRTGLLLLNEQENESETVKFGMALEGMHLRPGDRVRIADERRFEQRAGFRIREVDTSTAGQETLTLDTPAPRLAAGGRIVWGEGRSAEVSAAAETLKHEIALGAATVVTSTSADWSHRNDQLPASLGGGNVDRVILYRQGANWTAYVGASLDAGAAWEGFASAVQVTHPTVGTLVLAGPDHPSSAYRDASPPYNWFVGGGDGSEMRAWLAAYATLPVADRGGVTLRLVQPAPVNLQSPRLTTTNVPTGLGVGDLVAEESAVTDWIVTQLTERDKAEVQVAARRHDPGKYTAVEQRRELAPPLRTPVAPMAPPTAVTVVETTYRDRNLVRSQLEIAVRGGDHDPRIARVEYQIRRPKRRATAAEIKAGDWSVLPRGPWQPLRTTPARSIVVRDVALGGYRVRARFLGGRRESDWTRSAHVVADGKTDTLAAPAGLVVSGIAGGYFADWTRPDPDDYEYTEIWDKDGDAGPVNADIDVTDGTWTLRGTMSGSGFARVNVTDTDPLRVAIRHRDTSKKYSVGREVGVTPLEVVEGADGEDGAGVEYVFKATDSVDEPSAPSNSRTYDPTTSLNDGFTDGLAVTAALDYGHRWRRKVHGSPTRGAAVPADATERANAGWGDWIYDGVVAHWGAAGEDGREGVGVEYVFKATASRTEPTPAPSATRPYDPATRQTDGFTDGLTVTAALQHGHRWSRPVPSRPAVGQVPPSDATERAKEGWGDWRYDGVVAHWGIDGPPPPVTFSISATVDAQGNPVTHYSNLYVTTSAVAGADGLRFIVVEHTSDGHVIRTSHDVTGAQARNASRIFRVTLANGTPYVSRWEVSVHSIKTVDGEKYVGGPSPVRSATASPNTTLVTPVGTATPGDGEVFVNWNDPAGSTSFSIDRKVSGGQWASLATGLTTSEYRDTTAQNGVTYQYRVQAFGTNSRSGYWFSPAVTPSASTIAPSFSASAQTPSGDAGTAGSVVLPAASGAPAPTYTITGSNVPSWITFTASTRRLNWSSSAVAGTYALTLVATNSAGTARLSVTLTIDAAASFVWSSWSNHSADPGVRSDDTGDVDISNALLEAALVIVAWDTAGTPQYEWHGRGLWSGAGSQYGVMGTKDVNINGSLVRIQILQSYATSANRMRRTDTDAYFSTTISYLRTNLNTFNPSGFDAVDAIYMTSASPLPTGATTNRRAIGFARWVRTAGHNDGRGTQYLLVIPPGSGVFRYYSRTYGPPS